ncbi:protein of unknown function [Vreelandella subterranea]|uniref:DUF4376 domain-containing protein n=1 Tax=Vreelandella subterranea TaxID=416874 RepID=A0A1H9S376_9GAMM|nr:DUF4376 domain-containing protein [Halomonas subterranea]SER79085.1 protein of unknown function [Halomonas subterranea]
MLIWDINTSDGTAINPAGRNAPIEPMRETPRLPAGATNVQRPETGEHEEAVFHFDANEWEVVADYRGHIYWTADCKKHEIKELGTEPPDDALDEAPPEPLADVAARKRREIESARKSAEAQGVEVSGIRYAGDPGNRQAIREALEAAEDKGQEVFARWKDSDNAWHIDHSVADVWDALRAIAARRSELINQEGELNAQIDAALEADDRAALESVAWTDG